MLLAFVDRATVILLTVKYFSRKRLLPSHARLALWSLDFFLFEISLESLLDRG